MAKLASAIAHMDADGHRKILQGIDDLIRSNREHIRNDIVGLRSDLEQIRNDIGGLVRPDLRQIRNDISILRAELDFVRTRLSSYLGDGIALTYLVDETPIYVNSNDFGPPVNFINGGRYEEDNLAVIFSFLREDSVFLDVGANLGFYSLRVGARIHRFGKVHAFEPHPLLQDLLKRSVFLNGLNNAVVLHPCGLSDTNSAAQFGYPRGHLGGGAVHTGATGDREIVQADLKRLDDLMGPDFSCDVVKIDVEGHELQVLRGMPRIIANSPHVKILFENFSSCADQNKKEIETLLQESGFDLYAIDSGAALRPMAQGELLNFSGYVLAARPADLPETGHRLRFSIYPRQFLHPGDTLRELDRNKFTACGSAGQILFHGPYWFLPQGVWRIKIHGKLRGSMSVALAARYGHVVTALTLRPAELEGVFVCERDLVKFECVARALEGGTEVVVERVDLIREG